MSTASEIEVMTEDRALRASSARPEDRGPEMAIRPDVLVIHEIFGLDDVRGVAQDECVALTVDLFAGQSHAVCMTRMFGGVFLNALEYQGARDTQRGLAVALACTSDRVHAVAPYSELQSPVARGAAPQFRQQRNGLRQRSGRGRLGPVDDLSRRTRRESLSPP